MMALNIEMFLEANPSPLTTTGVTFIAQHV